MAGKAALRLIAILSMLAISGCTLLVGASPRAIDDNARVLGRDLGRRAALGETVDARGAMRDAAIRLGLDEPGRRRFAEIFWVQFERGYFGAGPYRLTPGGGGEGGL